MPGPVLISFNRADQTYVDQLIAQLTAAGLAPVTAPDAFEEHLDAAAVVLAVLTPTSVAEVDRETELAQRHGRPVVAVILGGFLPARLAGSIHEDRPDGALPSAEFIRRLSDLATGSAAPAPAAPAQGSPVVTPAPTLPSQPTVAWTPPAPAAPPTYPQHQPSPYPQNPPPGYPPSQSPSPYQQSFSPAYAPPGQPFAGAPYSTENSNRVPLHSPQGGGPSRTGVVVAIGLAVVLAVAAVSTALVLTGGNGDHGIAAPPKSNGPVAAQPPALIPTTAPAGPASVRCDWQAETAGPSSGSVGTPDEVVPARGTQTLTMTTNRGVITVDMSLAATPCTAASMAHLANAHFYDHTSCHRLVTDIFTLQCGDPTGTGEGGPGYQFADENVPDSTMPAYHAGDVAMANGGPDTNGSQFFFVYQDSQIPGGFSLFGHVTSGLDIIRAVGAGGDDEAYAQEAGGGHPLIPLTFTSITATPPTA